MNVLKERYPNLEFIILSSLDVNNPSSGSSAEMDRWVKAGHTNFPRMTDKVEQEIAEVDYVVLTPYYREEVPRSLLKAGAMAKPIVTTDNVSFRETVDHGVNGFLCEVKLRDDLVEKLSRILKMTHDNKGVYGGQK